MKNNIMLVIIFSIGMLTSCEEPIFIPVQGKIRGTVADENGLPMTNVEVVAIFDQPTDFGAATSVSLSSKTNSDGAFWFENVWDRVELQINQDGFQPIFKSLELVAKNTEPEVDFILVGSPRVQGVSFSETTLGSEIADSIDIFVEVEDLFNSVFGPYICQLLIQNDQEQTSLILNSPLLQQSQTQYLFENRLVDGMLENGTYRVLVEVTDPDGNTNQKLAGETITVQ